MKGQALKQAPTNHPFVVRNKNVCNGSPIIEGTRTRVIDIAIEYEILGHALSYYYENRDELDRKIEQDQELIGELMKKFPSKMAQPYGQN